MIPAAIVIMMKTGKVRALSTSISIKSLNRIAVMKNPEVEIATRPARNQLSGRLARITENRLIEPSK